MNGRFAVQASSCVPVAASRRDLWVRGQIVACILRRMRSPTLLRLADVSKPLHQLRYAGSLGFCLYALRRVNKVISGGTPIRTGNPNVPSPRFT
jgi:hypothetical protein